VRRSYSVMRMQPHDAQGTLRGAGAEARSHGQREHGGSAISGRSCWRGGVVGGEMDGGRGVGLRVGVGGGGGLWGGCFERAGYVNETPANGCSLYGLDWIGSLFVLLR